jgi:hypothetical protein
MRGLTPGKCHASAAGVLSDLGNLFVQRMTAIHRSGREALER